MMQKPAFKVFVWFIATTFFFLVSAMIISYLGPEPSMRQIMQFMSGMMRAMENSMMGLSMSLEEDGFLKSMILFSSGITMPLLLLGIILAILVRIKSARSESGQRKRR